MSGFTTTRTCSIRPSATAREIDPNGSTPVHPTIAGQPLTSATSIRRPGMLAPCCATATSQRATLSAPVIGRSAAFVLPPAVADQDDVGRQGREQRIEVAAADRGEEPLGHLALRPPVGVEPRLPRVHVLARTVRHLPDGGLRAAEDSRDLRRRQAEGLAEDEHRPLGRRQRLEDDEQGQRHLLAELGRVLRCRRRRAAATGEPPVSSGSGSQGPT